MNESTRKCLELNEEWIEKKVKTSSEEMGSLSINQNPPSITNTHRGLYYCTEERSDNTLLRVGSKSIDFVYVVLPT